MISNKRGQQTGDKPRFPANNKNPRQTAKSAGALVFRIFTQFSAYFIASSTATAQATVAPTIGLLPMQCQKNLPLQETTYNDEKSP